MTALAAVSFKKGREHRPRLSTPYVPGVRHERYWTNAEIEIIKTYYGPGGVNACLAHLPNRTPSGVYVQAGKLGLTSKQRGKIKRPEGFDDALREFYQNGDGKKKGECNAFADRMKVPRWWITKRAIALGLVIPHKKEPPWTAAENALMAKVPLHDVDKCAEIFREHGFSRSPTAIMVRAKRLNLSRRYRETLSATAIGKILGVDSKTVTREIIQGDLKAIKRKTRRLPQQGGDHWSVTPTDLRRYLLDHLERVDLRKVDKFAFVQIVAGEALSI